MDQRSEEWYQARVGKITASEFGAVMAKGRGGKESEQRKTLKRKIVAERLSGISQDSGYQSPDMRHGIDTEAEAVAAIELDTGWEIEECGLILWEKNPNIGASPDRLVFTPNGCATLEVKCPRPSTHLEWLDSEDMPEQHLWQVVGQVLVTASYNGWLVSYCPSLPGDLALIYWSVMAGDANMAALAEELLNFDDEIEAEVKRLRSRA